jgi:hypothetical protein
VQVLKYASYNGQGEAASKCVDFYLRYVCIYKYEKNFYQMRFICGNIMLPLFPRASDNFDELRESPMRDPSTAEAMKSQIVVLLGALDQY